MFESKLIVFSLRPHLSRAVEDKDPPINNKDKTDSSNVLVEHEACVYGHGHGFKYGIVRDF